MIHILFYLQKLSEAQITKASNTPDNQVINEAEASGMVKPKRKINIDILESATYQKVASPEATLPSGKFVYSISKPGKYEVIASTNRYSDGTTEFIIPTDYSIGEINIKIELKPLKKELIILPNFFFDFDKFSIRKEDSYKIDELFRILTENQDIKLEIRGYTDFIGNRNYNIKLGKNRSAELTEEQYRLFFSLIIN